MNPLSLALLKPYDLMTDQEFDAVMHYERWCKKAIYQTKQYLSQGEAFEIFQDDIYALALDTGNTELLWQFKKWRSGNYHDKDKAKAYPIEQLMTKYGLENRHGQIHCPFHGDDRSPSLKLYYNTNTWFCFGCNNGGDVIDFVMKKQGINFISAVKQLI